MFLLPILKYKFRKSIIFLKYLTQQRNRLDRQHGSNSSRNKTVVGEKSKKMQPVSGQK